jgi:hypothetical protein
LTAKAQELSADVLMVTFEFLTGSFSFGNLANRNVGNHEIHEATLPISFELVLSTVRACSQFH